jgi:hypothetical protein
VEPLEQEQRTVQKYHEKRVTKFDKFTQKKCHDPKTARWIFSPIKVLRRLQKCFIYNELESVRCQAQERAQTVEPQHGTPCLEQLCRRGR